MNVKVKSEEIKQKTKEMLDVLIFIHQEAAKITITFFTRKKKETMARTSEVKGRVRMIE